MSEPSRRRERPRGGAGWSDLPLRTKGIIVLAIPLIALFAAVFAMFAMQNEHLATHQSWSQAFVVQAEVQELLAAAVEAESCSRALALTGDAAFGVAAETAERTVRATLQKISAALAKDPEQSGHVAALAGAVTRELEELKAVRERRATVRPDDAMEAVRSAVRAIRQRQDQARAAAVQSLAVHESRYRLLLVLGALVGPLGGLMGNILLAATIVRRLRALIRNANLVAQGSPIIPLPPANDEVGVLAWEIEEAARLLQFREQQFRRNARRYQDLFDNAPVPYHEAGRDGVIQSVNRAECELLGYEERELVGHRMWEFVAPEQQDEARVAILRKIVNGQEGPPVEREYVRKNGTRVAVEVHEALIRDEQGTVVGVRRALFDISERRVAQIAARKVEEYAHELRSKNEQLVGALAAARHATEAKSRFLAGLSHEFRAPLNSIIGFSELLYDGRLGAVAAEHREYIGDILTSARHLLHLITRVQDLSKVESGKMEFRIERFAISAVVAEVCDGVRPLAERKHIELASEIPVDFEVAADAACLRQILHHYLSNALKYTPGGGRITVRAATEGGGEFRVEVEDTGEGVAPSDQERLFQEFPQIAHGGSVEEGSGLGLALTRRLAEAQGGRVEARSQVGKGSVFSVVLPLEARVERSPGSPASAPASRRIQPPPRRTVLVVNGNPAESRWLRRILMASGYRAEIAATRADAVACCRQRQYHAITLDLILPDGTGWDALREIRVHTENRRTPAIVVAAAGDKDGGAGFPVDDVLPKPATPEDLAHVLERVGVPAGSGQAILVVDDDAACLEQMRVALSGLGYRAVCRAGGGEGLQAAVEEQPAAVLLDPLMHGTDGFEFLDNFRNSRPGVPVIVCSGDAFTADARSQLQLTARKVLARTDNAPATLLARLRALPE